MGLTIVLVRLMMISIVVLVMSMEAQGTSSSCIEDSSNLYTCFPYVKAGNDSTVGPECCKPLATYVNAYPECLSTLRNLSLEIPNVNLTRANELNILCSITAPSPSNNGSTGSPSPSPSAPVNKAMVMANRFSVVTNVYVMMFVSLLTSSIPFFH